MSKILPSQINNLQVIALVVPDLPQVNQGKKLDISTMLELEQAVDTGDTSLGDSKVFICGYGVVDRLVSALPNHFDKNELQSEVAAGDLGTLLGLPVLGSLDVPDNVVACASLISAGQAVDMSGFKAVTVRL